MAVKLTNCSSRWDCRFTPSGRFGHRRSRSSEAGNNGTASSLLDSRRGVASRELLETNEAFREPIRRQQQIVNWLRLVTNRRGEAQQERIRAVVKAYESGLSIS
jgi:hypothetical protein